MTRLRTKGGANPETLYELTNGYVTASRTIKQRPAAVYAFSVPSASRGLCQFKGTFYTFSAAPVTPVAGSTNLVLVNPSPSFSGTLSKVHFAHPFMELLYVVAEFSDSSVYHYWLQSPAAWTANTIYKANDLVQPSTPNGLYYKAVQTVSAAPAWTAGLQHRVGDIVQPTVYNGYQYTVGQINGSAITTDTANSGQTEPTWPESPGALVLESSAGTPVTASPAPEPPPATPPGRESGGRYTNPGGTGGRLGLPNTPVRIP